MSKFFWGIDIGKSSLKAVKLEKLKGNQLQIVDLELVEFEQTGDEDVDREEQIRDALARFKGRKKFKGETLFFSIPGHGTFNRTVSLPPVDAKQIPEMVRWEAQQQIPFPIDEVIWDWQKIDNEEDFGEVEVNLFAVKKEVIHNFLATLEGSGFEVGGIQIAPLALFNFITYDQQPPGAMVAIDMGAEYSDLVVLNGTRIWIRNLQIAGNEITRAVQSKFQIPFGEAEKLKLKAAKSKHANKIFQVMKPILKDLVGEIHRSVGYYKSQNPDVRFDKVLLMGNGTKLVGFKRFFRDNLSDYTIELIKGLKRISVSNRVNVNLLSQNIASFGIALGLAVQAAGEAVNNVVLIPEEKKRAEALSKKKPLYIVALIVLALVCAWKYTATSSLISEIKEKEKQAAGEVKKVEAAKKEWEQKKGWGSLLGDIQKIGSIDPHAQKWADVVDAIYGLVPKNNDRQAAAEVEKDKDMMWFFSVQLEGQSEKVSFKSQPNQPRIPDATQYSLVGKIGICIVAAPDGQVVQDTRRIDDLVVEKLRAKLAELGLEGKVEPGEYFWVDKRSPRSLVEGEAADGWAEFFCRWVNINVKLNKVVDPRTKQGAGSGS